MFLQLHFLFYLFFYFFFHFFFYLFFHLIFHFLCILYWFVGKKYSDLGGVVQYIGKPYGTVYEACMSVLASSKSTGDDMKVSDSIGSSGSNSDNNNNGSGSGSGSSSNNIDNSNNSSGSDSRSGSDSGNSNNGSDNIGSSSDSNTDKYQTYSINKNRICGVGDSLDHDIEGARRAGIDSIWTSNGVHSEEMGTIEGSKECAEENVLQGMYVKYGIIPAHTIAMFHW